MAVSPQRVNTLLDKTITALDCWLKAKSTRKWSDNSDVPPGLRDIPTLCEYLAALGLVPDAKRIKGLKDSVIHDYMDMILSRMAADAAPSEKAQFRRYGPLRGVGSDEVEQYRWDAIVGQCLQLKEQLEAVRNEISKDNHISDREAAKLYLRGTGAKSGHKWIRKLVNEKDPRLQLRPDGILRRENVMFLIACEVAKKDKVRRRPSAGRFACLKCGGKTPRLIGAEKVCIDCFRKSHNLS